MPKTPIYSGNAIMADKVFKYLPKSEAAFHVFFKKSVL